MRYYLFEMLPKVTFNGEQSLFAVRHIVFSTNFLLTVVLLIFLNGKILSLI